MRKFVPDVHIWVHMGYDSDIKGDWEKALLISKHMKPHIDAKRRELEHMFDKFMELTLEDLQDIFDERPHK